MISIVINDLAGIKVMSFTFCSLKRKLTWSELILVSTQAEILALFRILETTLGMSILYARADKSNQILTKEIFKIILKNHILLKFLLLCLKVVKLR